MPPIYRLRRYWPLLVLAAIGAAFYFAVGRFIDGARTLESLERLDPRWLLAALGCAATLYLLKALRWYLFLRAIGHPLAGRSALVTYIAGQWFAVARGADLSRVVIVGRFGVPYAMAVAVVTAASLTDFAGVAALGLAGTLWHRDLLLPLLIATAGISALIWALGGSGPLGKMIERELPIEHGEAVQRGRRLLRGRPLAEGLAISVLDALAAGGVMWCSAQALGLGSVSPILACVVFSAAQIAGVMSLMPLGLGVVEASGILLLVASGVDPALATATLVVYRLTTLGMQMLLGGVGLLALRLLPLPGGASAERAPAAPATSTTR